MKTCILFLCVFLPASLGLGQGLLYYFSGRVSNLVYDGGGVLAAQNVAVGDPVSANFIVDFGSPGYFLHNDGTIEIAEWPPLSNVSYEFFYSRLASGTLLPELNGGLNNEPGDIREYFLGSNSSGPTGNDGRVQGGSGNSYISITKSSLGPGYRVQDWIIGTSVRGTLVGFSDQDWSFAWVDMTLDSITPIPEPSGIYILIIGGLTGVMRNRGRAKQRTGCKGG